MRLMWMAVLAGVLGLGSATAQEPAASVADSAGRMFQAAITLKKPRKEPPRQGGTADKVDLSIFIPVGVKTVRGAVMNPFYVPTVGQKHWQDFCRLHSMALIGSNHFGVTKDEFASTLQSALDEWATSTGHAELRTIPFCFVGMSAGGGMARQFALAMPERTIAVAPVCLEVAPDEQSLRPIPFLNVFGEKDGKQMPLHLEKLPAARKQGALWGVAVQWGRGHEFALANNLILPFFDDVIRARLGPDGLKPVAAEQGWLGDVAAWGEKKRVAPIAAVASPQGIDPSSACWFPSGGFAATWQAFVLADKRLVIDQPPGLGDKQPYVPHIAGKPIRIAASCKEPAVTQVDLYIGDKRVASRTAAPFDFEWTAAAGIHPLYVVARTPGGDIRSRPHTLVVLPP